jgi:cell division protein YceG involved in septum cleavage
MSRLEVGDYTFDGRYTPASFVAHVLTGSEKNFTRVTILEGWSIYDIDDYLVKQGLIQKGDYIGYVTNNDTLMLFKGLYEFLEQA